MKKIAVIFFTGFLILGFLSCTPESVSSNVGEYQDCCNGDDNIPPPPPPPPSGDGN